MGDIIENLIPLSAVVLIFGMPIVAMFTHHQRRMAELLRDKGAAQSAASDQQVAALRNEVAELRQLVHQQAIELDSLKALGQAQANEVRQ